MKKNKGRVTLPSQQNFLKETKELMERWGADALRDSDGTKLDDELKRLDAAIYTTYFVARSHNEFAEQHPEEMQQLYLMSKYNTAADKELTISFLDGYFEEQVEADYIHDPKSWWEVIDRTTGKVVDPEFWEVKREENCLVITNAVPWHEYTVSFLSYMKWDPTQMYNHITNNWGNKPHEIPFDIRQPHSNQFIKEYLQKWLKENPDTDVVRFTTFFYHFTLIFNSLGKEKFVDWFGYGASVSVAALEAFAKEKGYRLRPEDIVDQGYYNSTFRTPSKAYLDYMDFIQRFVVSEIRELVDAVHGHDKEAMMFLGDNWIGAEPYGEYFRETGLDAVVGSVGDGTTLRMIADIPHVKYTEGRFLPYFFPDTFYEGNDPVVEAEENWLTARRALLRKPLDRIGYGGYLSLACKFPAFVDYVEKVTDEFRCIHDTIHHVKPYTGLKVAVLNAWGKLRTWQTHMVAHGKYYQQTYSYQGILEALSGSAVDVIFLSFDDVKESGIPEGVDVLINAGDAGTAFSGGENWLDESLTSKIREWVYKGGGLIGIGEPSACHHQGRFFQLADILGVDKELGFSLSTNKYFTESVHAHFITENMTAYDFGESKDNIYALKEDTDILKYSNGSVHLSSSPYGEGRGVYIAGLPYSHENTDLLIRALFYAANKESEYKVWHASNPHCEVHAYPDIKKYAIVNNSKETQVTLVYDGTGASCEVTLGPGELKWEDSANEG
ncbi:D-galactosyl-beta-1-3-N-acetyl-D-hexosamine phosphorylase [Sporosarcina globispora]|uniref:D-galactosyl-beta-1-3-N-acetyl-D-hexosamine phosphorylase n=1 Tax=Sporosarcina globispora TaxID=1459 RepID=A0A0M0GKM1_SPOGL|nr:1,3-beta-galactosyl-N-acetylhexosamine phosphorylase [Sporosarcina globispora]KON90455.1 D-galactosyl-beta-1-3-N-acetyl-D-hexosamine phosphorylase [Sporosarcina globispora]